MMSMRPEPLKYSLSFNREVDTGKLGLRNKLISRPASLRRTFWEYFVRLKTQAVVQSGQDSLSHSWKSHQRCPGPEDFIESD